MQAVRQETARNADGSAPGAVASLNLYELPRLREHHGTRASGDVLRHVSAHVMRAVPTFAAAGRDHDDNLLLLLAGTGPLMAKRRLARLAQELAAVDIDAGGLPVRVTPSIGFATYEADPPPAERLLEQAGAATLHAASFLDLQPTRYAAAMDPEWRQAEAHRRVARIVTRLEPFRLPFQIVATQILAIAIPLLIYVMLAMLWMDVTPVVYLIVTIALFVTGALIWIEGFEALEPRHPPEQPKVAYPPASAIIAAYLPNEAATILDTVGAFLSQDYPADFQVILAYNTAHDFPVEVRLRAIAARDRRFVLLRVEGSTSKAQNVNAALAIATGRFTGVFDADHHPDLGSFARAWRWLDSGYSVVQGHCLVRNGADSWLARLVAVEFEAIYAVSHPGRSRMHGFGVFGGSNGYWLTDLLRETRFQVAMLTEDIDSGMRAVESGHRICSDPFLISRELGPVSLKALWNQRMRWAQGWFQVSLKHLPLGLGSGSLTPQQKVGFVHLMIWRELYPWLSVQMVPIIVFWLYWYGPSHIDWLVPIWVLTSIFMLSVVVGQTLFAWLLAEPEIRKRGDWFLSYLLISLFFYGPVKNLITVIAQVKESMGERVWKITPRAPGRTVSTEAAALDGPADRRSRKRVA